jgi:hypothetical protein
MTEIKSNLKMAICWEAEKYFAANKDKNKASTEERKAQKELDILTAQALGEEFGKFEHTFQYKDRPVTVEITYQQDIRDITDVKALYGKVPLESFLNIVTASNAAVVREVGKNIAAQCTTSKIGEFKVKVKEKK